MGFFYYLCVVLLAAEYRSVMEIRELPLPIEWVIILSLQYLTAGIFSVFPLRRLTNL